MENNKPTGLALLRVPFERNQISKLPKPTKEQTEEVKSDFKKGIRCSECGGWHHPKVVHLDYVGHAALTDRLLDVDPNWNWEPMSTNSDGSPKFDESKGLWIKLTICGVTRIGYGHPDGKSGGDAIKETIGDALRNAAMRFGAALDLWHKGDLHADSDEKPATRTSQKTKEASDASKEQDPFEYVINLGDKNKLSKTKIKEHDINFLVTERDRLLDYYKKENKQPHKNVVEFSAMLDTALRLTAEKIKI